MKGVRMHIPRIDAFGNISTLIRLFMSMAAFIPLIIVTICCVPGLLAWPFVASTHQHGDRRIRLLIRWTWLIMAMKHPPGPPGDGTAPVTGSAG
jgi:hypothetical protein